MLSTWWGMTLLILFNATVCIALPRVLTIDWQQAIAQFANKIKSQDQIEPAGSVESVV